MWEPLFLKTLADHANVRAACKVAGISRESAYKRKRVNKEFSDRWDAALLEAVEVLEAAAWSRATTTSDTLLIFLLKAHKPEKYRETTRNEITGKDGGPVEIIENARNEVARRIAGITARKRAAGDTRES